jgi:DHA1 family putative efflux transporter-like MFS transporter
MKSQEAKVGIPYRNRLFMFLLLLSMFLTATFEVFLSNALVNVSTSLKINVGTASQILTIGSFVGLLVGLIMGLLTVRFKHKSLFLLGIAFFAFGALGSFFAPDFLSILFFSLFLGIGGTMTGIVVLALIGDFLPLDKKGLAMGLAMGGTIVANLIVPQVTSIITDVAGWRFVLLWFIFPISMVCLIFGLIVLPSNPWSKQSTNKPQYSEAVKQIRSCMPIWIGTC